MKAGETVDLVRSSAGRPDASPGHALRVAVAQRGLIGQLAAREVLGRYRGSILGLAWSFLNPLLMLVAYTFVFNIVFGARWGTRPAESGLDFALVLFVGLMLYALFAECFNKAPTLVLANPNLVKKVVFPLEVLAVVAVGAATFHLAVAFAVFVGAAFVIQGGLPVTALLFPLIVLPLLLLTLGATWILASLGVYLRDVAQTTTVLTTVLLFLSPVFYPASALPERYRPLLHLNPLTFPIEQAREVVIWGRWPDWSGLGLYTLVALAVAMLGFWWFQRTRTGFADVI